MATKNKNKENTETYDLKSGQMVYTTKGSETQIKFAGEYIEFLHEGNWLYMSNKELDELFKKRETYRYWLKAPKRCKQCMHRKDHYCRAYMIACKMLDTHMCKRRKEREQ